MKPDNPYQEDFAAIKAFEKLPENRIKVSTKLENPHPIIADTLKVLAHKEVLDGMCVTPKHSPVIGLYVTPQTLDRALRISDALFKALENRGIKITARKTVRDKKEATNATFVIRGVEIVYHIEEPLRRCAVSPETREAKRLGIHADFSGYEYRRTGLFRLHGFGQGADSILIERSRFRPIEDRLNAFVVGMHKQIFKILHSNQSTQERVRRERNEEQRLRHIQAQLTQKEQQKTSLKQMAADHHQALQIRQFLQAYEAAGNVDSAWLSWAKECADEIDPVVS